MSAAERAKAEAERRWPKVNQPTFGPDDYMDMGARSGFEAGATFAATVTAEQVEAAELAALRVLTTEEPMAHEVVSAVLDAMGFEVAE